MTNNNVGDALDSSGQVAVDFVWGNFPLQPNDDRNATIGQIGGAGVTTAKITDASSTGKITTFTTDVAHGLSVGQVVNTGTYAIGGTVASPVAGTTVSATTGTSTSVTLAATTVTADTTQKTVTLTTSAAHNISVGESVTITGGLTTAAVYNGTFVALAGTTGSTLVVANAAAAVASPANSTTACAVAVNHFDVKELPILSVPSTTTFTVAQALPNIGSVAPTGKTASLELVGDSNWSVTTKAASTRLNLTLDNHGRAGTGYGGYPGFASSGANFIVTAASGNGTTVTYTSQNRLAVGDVVNITGLTTSAFNLSSATVATANAVSFTVTNAAGSGVTITGQTGKVEATNAADLGDGATQGNILVPSVLGLTTALALDALQDRGFVLANITSNTGTTAKQPTRITVTTTTAATVYLTNANTLFSVGASVTIGSGTGVPAALVGTWTVTAADSTTLTIKGTGWTVADTSTITPGTVLSGATGTVTYQTPVANAASIAYGSSATITAWA